MDQCIFCKIIDGSIPSYTIYEDLDFKVILDAFPSGQGHTLILTKQHVANIFDMDEALLAKAQILAQKIAKAVKKYIQCDGVNIIQNNGISAGQTVFHYHIHIVPRFENDGLQLGWKTKSFTPEVFEQIKEGIVGIL